MKYYISRFKSLPPTFIKVRDDGEVYIFDAMDPKWGWTLAFKSISDVLAYCDCIDSDVIEVTEGEVRAYLMVMELNK